MVAGQEHEVAVLVAQEAAGAVVQEIALADRLDHERVFPRGDGGEQAGGGEAELVEAAQEALIENATHGDGRAKPLEDAFNPEREADLSGAAYGEADEEKVHEVTRDPDDPSSDDPGAGPGITHER